MKNTGISNPARHWVNYAPIKDQFVHDPHAPDDDQNAMHLEALDRGSDGYGFPVGRPLGYWPPTRKDAEAFGLRRIWR